MPDITSIKPLGVAIPKGQQQAREAMSNQAARPVGKANTVVDVKKLQTYVVHYFDAKGEMQRALVHQAGDQLLVHKADAQWVKELRTVNEKLGEQVLALIPAALSEKPVTAAPDVDVLMDDNVPMAEGQDAPEQSDG